jgi:DNA-directed RNA polymerase subunit K/omega
MRTVFQAFSRAAAPACLACLVCLAVCALPAPARAAVADRALGPAAQDTGFLDVASDPPAKIAIDDAETGKVTPQPHLELKVGHHKLTLVTLDGAHRRTIGFNIEPGQTTKLTLHLAG